MELIALMLSLIVLASVSVTMTHYELQAELAKILNSQVAEAVDQQVTFANAVSEYIEESNLTEGATITPGALEAANILPVGFAATNPFGQTPIAFVGANSTALVTYTGLGSANYLESLGVNPASSLSMSGLAAKEIFRASQEAEPYASKLVSVEIEGASASTPYGGETVALGNFFSGYPSMTEPVFAILVNLDTVYSGSETP